MLRSPFTLTYIPGSKNLKLANMLGILSDMMYRKSRSMLVNAAAAAEPGTWPKNGKLKPTVELSASSWRVVTAFLKASAMSAGSRKRSLIVISTVARRDFSFGKRRKIGTRVVTLILSYGVHVARLQRVPACPLRGGNGRG